MMMKTTHEGVAGLQFVMSRPSERCLLPWKVWKSVQFQRFIAVTWHLWMQRSARVSTKGPIVMAWMMSAVMSAVPVVMTVMMSVTVMMTLRTMMTMMMMTFLCYPFQFECCGVGVDSYKDWSKNAYFNCSEGNPSAERCGVPYSCCVTENDIDVGDTPWEKRGESPDWVWVQWLLDWLLQHAVRFPWVSKSLFPAENLQTPLL